MTSTADLLADAFTRVQDTVHGALDGMTGHQLSYRPGPDANTVAWLVWHLTRVQDDHVAGAAGIEQVWTAQGFVDRFNLPFDRAATGYAQSTADVAAVRPHDPYLLLSYLDAVTDQTVGYIRTLTDADLNRIIDENWDPPVTLAVRLISVINDDLQHAGQAAYVAGLARA